MQSKLKDEEEGICTTLDGTVDWHGRPAIRSKSGRWLAGIIILCKLSLSLSKYIFLKECFFNLNCFYIKS